MNETIDYDEDGAPVYFTAADLLPEGGIPQERPRKRYSMLPLLTPCGYGAYTRALSNSSGPSPRRWSDDKEASSKPWVRRHLQLLTDKLFWLKCSILSQPYMCLIHASTLWSAGTAAGYSTTTSWRSRWILAAFSKHGAATRHF